VTRRVDFELPAAHTATKCRSCAARCAFCNGSGKGNWLSTAILAEDARRQAEPNVLRATLAAVREKVKELDFGHDTECRANIWPDRGTCDCDHDDNAAVVSALSKVLEQTP
jgi:hypothetical protein